VERHVPGATDQVGGIGQRPLGAVCGPVQHVHGHRPGDLILLDPIARMAQLLRLTRVVRVTLAGMRASRM
jgi:hypothetical protein